MEQQPPLTGFARIIVNIALALGTFLIVLDYSIANVSLPYIAGDLAVSPDQGTYVITFFAVGNAIILAVTGWLTKRIGAIRLFCLSLLLFTILSWFCGSSTNFYALIVFRFLQGAAAGPLIPLSQSLTISINPPEKRNASLSFWSFIVIVAPVIGPLLGGWLTFDYSWPWIFYINLPVGAFSTVVIWHMLKHRETKTEKAPVDLLGFILLALGVTALQILLDKGQQWDWFRSPLIRILSVTSIVSLSLLVAWEFTTSKPLLDLKLFKIRTFANSIIIIAVAYAIYFGTVVLVPLWLQVYMGYNSVWAGLAVAPMGLAPTLFAFSTGKIIEKWGKIYPLLLSFLLFALSCFYSAFFTVQVDYWTIAFSRFLLGCALIFFFIPLIALSVQDIPYNKLPSATGIFHFVRAMVGAIGTSLFTTLWERRTSFHHLNLGSSMTSLNPNTTEALNSLKEYGLEGKKALEVLNQQTDVQSAMLSINDCFWVMGWIFLALILVLPFCHSKKDSLSLKKREG